MTTITERPGREQMPPAPAPSRRDEHSPSRRAGRLRRTARRASIVLAAGLLLLVAVVAYSVRQTESDIQAFRDRVADIGSATPAPTIDDAAVAELPAPVQRYFEFVFVEPLAPYGVVELTSSGEFRRPLTEGFNSTSAEQTIATGTPSLMFSARVDMFPGLWARAYDFYADGEMEMRAKVNSTLTVVDESATPALNQTSLQRWLLESPLYPMALLPGGPVRWEAVDDTHARAIVSADGLEASLVATFAEDGSLASFDAETDGDLTTSYHGAGEHAERSDYRLVDGIMIPHRFSLARGANGEIFPFFVGEIDTIGFR